MKQISLPEIGEKSYSVKLLIGPDTVIYAHGNSAHVIGKGEKVECCEIGDVINVAKDRSAFVTGSPSYWIESESRFAYVYSTREENILSVCTVEGYK